MAPSSCTRATKTLKMSESHGQVLALCLREAGDWTVFLRYRGGDEYAFLGRRGDGETEASLVLRSSEGAADLLTQLMDDSLVTHELLLMPASAAQASFAETVAMVDEGEVASLVFYTEARPLSHDRALLLLGLLRECLPK